MADDAIRLEPPAPGPESAAAFVKDRLADLCGDEAPPSPRFRGGQRAADAALARFSVAGYAARRNQVWPPERRGASALSPYIRHGLLPLRRVWEEAAGGPARDVRKFHDELLWQEYARHLYARLGPDLAESLRADPPAGEAQHLDPWPRAMACMDATVGELERDGWLVNQTRMWLASQWAVRHRAAWQAGEDRFFRHLLDGSRAANRLGWQWTVGAANGKPYGFSRWQVEKRAPALCRKCALETRCPIERWPESTQLPRRAPPERLRRDPDLAATRGPAGVVEREPPACVWLTAESLGIADPALRAWPAAPAVYVFDVPLLRRLRLSSKRLIFLVETLAELAGEREVELWRGRPAHVLSGRRVAATFTPVPGWRRLARGLAIAALHPWPWLASPVAGPIASFHQWRKALRDRPA